MKPCSSLYEWIYVWTGVAYVPLTNPKRFLPDPWCQYHVTDDAPIDIEIE